MPLTARQKAKIEFMQEFLQRLCFVLDKLKET